MVISGYNSSGHAGVVPGEEHDGRRLHDCRLGAGVLAWLSGQPSAQRHCDYYETPGHRGPCCA
jgi:hypothetical protein